MTYNIDRDREMRPGADRPRRAPGLRFAGAVLAVLLVASLAVIGVVTALNGYGESSAGTETAGASRAQSITVAGSAGPTPGSADSATSSTTAPYIHPITDPERIVVPAIGVEATIVDVGLQTDGLMQTPDFGYAGWFSVGPAPGAPGPAVVVAHVDTKGGPDVFYRLRELKPGDIIEISDKAGDTATFAMDSSELAPKSEFPTTRIWNGTNDPVIRLITCGGSFDRSSGHYRANVIVYGHLVK